MYLMILVSVGFLAVSCEKYDEGGSVKKADKTIEGTWKLTGYLRDGVDETTLVSITGFTEIFTAPDTYTRKYTEEDGTVHDDTGTYKFATDNLSVNISGVSSINNFSAANSTVSSSTYTILKLDGSEFWYQYENGGSLHQFRMTKQ